MKGNKILITGGCGYIGGHTIVDLLDHGFEVISVDDLSRGSLRMLEGIEEIKGKFIKNYKVDLTNLDETLAIFQEHPDITGIIHFAAYKSVGESVNEPIKYFRNNINSLLNILDCAHQFDIKHIVFSSSCSVYGNPDSLPVSEHTPLKEAESPYARTKQMGEQICQDYINAVDAKIVLLRYFNPVGAHPSAHIGELQEKPENLVPVITATAIGKRGKMMVFGNDYDTRDGSCIRDYIHVMDVAHAHTCALQQMLHTTETASCEVYNLGTGNGITVLEMINSFEKVSGVSLNYELAARRAGDVIAVYADNSKARTQLGWEAAYDLDAMMSTAWAWEQKMYLESKSPLN